jgi:hypothetical protein
MVLINYIFELTNIMSKLISVEGNILANIPLTDIQIIHTINQLKIPHFSGVFCRDELPNKVNVIQCGIINLDDLRGMGTHWCCWFKRGREKYYFDSYGSERDCSISEDGDIIPY